MNANPWVNPPSGRNGQTYDSPTFTGNISGAEKDFAKGGLPGVNVSSGSMGNNGALTGITALDRTYAKCYILLPAGAIAAGVPAAATWYYAEFSSTTAATVYNNTYTSGIPAVPASKTPFVTTGPGAFTGVTAESPAFPSISIPANSIGANGALHGHWSGVLTNNANAKTMRHKFGGIQLIGVSIPSSTMFIAELTIQNQASSAVQQYAGGYFATSSNLGGNAGGQAIDTTSAVSLDQTSQKGVATDNIVHGEFNITMAFGA